MDAVHRGLKLLLVLVVSANAIVAGPLPAARACSCAFTTLEQRIEDAAAVAIVEAEFELPADDGEILWAARPIEVYKGAPPEVVQVSGGSLGSSCGHRIIRTGELLGVTISDDGRAWVAGCTGAIPINTLDALFAPIDQPDASGPPAFVVGHELPAARIALVDVDGELLALGPERRDVRLVAACPGGTTVATVVTGPHPATDVALVTRDVRTLEIIEEHALNIPDLRSLESPPIVDFACHTEDGSTISYLIPRHRKQAQRERHPELADSLVYLWENGVATLVPATTATGIALDLPNDTAYVIAGEDGATIERWRLSSATREATIPLPDLRAADVIVDPTHDGALVFAGPPKGRGVSIVLIVDDEAQVTNMVEDRRPLEIHPIDEGYVSLARDRRAGVMVQVRDDGAAVIHEYATHVSAPAPMLAASDPIAYVSGGTLRVLEAEDPDVTGRPTRVTALAGLPLESRALAIDVDDIPARFERDGVLPDATQGDQAAPIAAEDPAGDSGANPLPWIGAGAALLALLAAVGLWRRRRAN